MPKHERRPPPATLPGFPKAEKAKAKTRIGSGSSLRKRWKDPDGVFYEWDSRHGTVEKYDSRGNHLGEFDPYTGKRLKPPDPTRRVEP